MTDEDFDEFAGLLRSHWKSIGPDEAGRWFQHFRWVDLNVMRGVLADFKTRNRVVPKLGEIDAALRAAHPQIFPTEPKPQPVKAGSTFDYAAHIRQNNPQLTECNDAAAILLHGRKVFYRRLMSRSDRHGKSSELDQIKRDAIAQAARELKAAGYAWQDSDNAAAWMVTPPVEWKPFIEALKRNDMPRDNETPADGPDESTPDLDTPIDEAMQLKLLGLDSDARANL